MRMMLDDDEDKMMYTVNMRIDIDDARNNDDDKDVTADIDIDNNYATNKVEHFPFVGNLKCVFKLITYKVT